MEGENRYPQAGPGIGQSLKETREGRGLTLWQVEQETRIRSRYLRDLEHEDFDVLPPVYVLGSLKTYADFLGLDGTAISRELKGRLVQSTGPDIPAQLADAERLQNDGAAPAVGFDRLFLGMGVVLISILAVMTFVVALAQEDETPISQVRVPSTPEASSQMALAGNVHDSIDAQPRDRQITPRTENRKGDGRDGDGERKAQSEPPPKDGKEGSGQAGREVGEGSPTASVFEGVRFAPMSPSAPPAAEASSTASAPAVDANPSPTTPFPAASASPSSPVPVAPEPAASASAGAARSSSASATVEPETAANPPAPASLAPTPPAPTVPSEETVPPGPGGGRGQASPPTGVEDVDRVVARSMERVDRALREGGLGW